METTRTPEAPQPVFATEAKELTVTGPPVKGENVAMTDSRNFDYLRVLGVSGEPWLTVTHDLKVILSPKVDLSAVSALSMIDLLAIREIINTAIYDNQSNNWRRG